MGKKTTDFGWGNPYFLLELLDKTYFQKLAPHDIRNMIYAPDEGMTELIELTKEAIERSTGLRYKKVIITGGATQAISSILKFQSTYKNSDAVITTQYGYPYYQDMIAHQNLARIATPNPFLYTSNLNPFWLIDSPSNPEGVQFSKNMMQTYKTYWDAVYHSPIYTKDLDRYPEHIAMVGSYSKLLGVTGARVGWIATNRTGFFYEKIKDIVLKDTATISVPSQKLIIDILKDIDLSKFMDEGGKYLDANREQFQKIEYLFDGQPVQSVGMFYCAHADKKALQTLDDCGIKYVRLGEDYVRLSMGQTYEVTKEGVNRILKEDKKVSTQTEKDTAVLPPDVDMLKIMLEGAEIDYEENGNDGPGSTIFFNSLIARFDEDGRLLEIELE